MSADPFGTAGLRERALGAWRASPIRLREDANAEDDSARDAYRDRLVVELAQNAADAARRAGVPGRLLLRLSDDVLYAANTGAPIDAPGVEALSHRRASTKSAADVGRFGVGFTAVLAVTDEPSVHTPVGGVAWSLARTRAELAEVGEVAAEVSRRNGALPVMRLPWPTEPDDVVARLIDDGAATVVRLPMRDTDARRRTTELLESVDRLLLLFLDGLAEVTVEGVEPTRLLRRAPGQHPAEVVLDVDDERAVWRRHTVAGDLDPVLLGDRPAEERERAAWSATWAVPMVDGQPRPWTDDQRLRAPQPVDDVVALPMVLCATVPVESGRRHVVPGPVTDLVAREAARAYADLLAALPATPSVADLLPAALPGGAFDLLVRDALASRLPRTRLLPQAADADVRLRPDEAWVLDVGVPAVELTELLAPHVPRLVDPSYIAGGRRQAALTAMGTRLVGTADLVELLGSIDGSPAWWGRVLSLLATAPDRDALRPLPVPLADGSVSRDVRAALLPGDPAVDAAFAAAGLDLGHIHPDVVVDPRAADLLRLLGARAAEPAALLDDPRVRSAVETSVDRAESEPDAVTALGDAVLALLAREPAVAASRPWLAELALPSVDGEQRPAGELLLPREHGGRLVDAVETDGPLGVVSAHTVARHGPEAVVAAGVLATFGTLVEDDVLLAPDGLEGYLDEGELWLDDIAARLPDSDGGDVVPWVLDRVVAVRDLELVRTDPAAWHVALTELGGELLRTVVEPVTALRDRARAQLPSYTAWWLSRHECVPDDAGGLHRPGHVVASDADPLLAALYPRAAELSPPAARVCDALSLPREVTDLDAHQVSETLRRLGDVGPSLGAEVVRTGYAALLRRAEFVGARQPEVVCAMTAGGLASVPRHDVLVVDAPDLVPLLGPLARVPASLADAGALADLLDVDLASEAVTGPVVSAPVRVEEVPAHLRGPAAAWPARYAVHDPLVCRDASGADVAVPWRVVDREIHVDAADPAWGLSRALATLRDDWRGRHEVWAALVGDDPRRAAIVAEAELD